MNVTLDPSLVSTLGIPYNLSEMGEAGLFASLAVDFVQRFNFSAADDGVVTFMSPHARSSGYAAVQVFDKDGATTVDSQALFYNLKVVSPRQAAVCCFGLIPRRAERASRTAQSDRNRELYGRRRGLERAPCVATA